MDPTTTGTDEGWDSAPDIDVLDILDDLGPAPDPRVRTDLDDDDEPEDRELTENERAAAAEIDVDLDPDSQRFVDALVDKMMVVTEEVAGHTLYGYQKPFARRLIESLVINDGATVTALFSRQSGKSETVADVVAACMVMFPKLAAIFPQWFGKFAEGLWVGAFAPVEDQADNLFGRIVSRLTGERALEMMSDPEIDDSPVGKGKEVRLRSGSFVRKQTCHPRAIIEGRTYHLILIDEAQGAAEQVINKSVAPMAAATNGTMVMTGTPTYTKGVFYKTIQLNRRQATKRGVRTNHFHADWRQCARWNPNYGRFVKKEMVRIGEDSDEFRLSYRLVWMLSEGQFITDDVLDQLADRSMQPVQAWFASPCVVGIDPARKQDSTIVTVVWVGWDNPDPFGYYDHRVLNWLDLTGLDWEEQYFRIMEFLRNYSIHAIAVDTGGLGDVVISRLRVLLPAYGMNVDIVAMKSDQGSQSTRWKHLSELISRGRVGWPGHAKTRRTKTWKRFRQQMVDAQKVFKGPHMLVEAPREADAHDDYVDALALACALTADQMMPEIEQSVGLFFG